MSTLEEKLKEIEARFQNTRPRTLSNAVEWYSAYADLEALIAMLRKCREQRLESTMGLFQGDVEGINKAEAEDDAELLKLAQGEGK